MRTLIILSLTDSRYKEKFTTICEEIFEFGLKEHEKREAEIASFFSCLEEATKDNNNAGVKHIHNYIEYKKKVRTLVSVAGPNRHMKDTRKGDGSHSFHLSINQSCLLKV